jgi:hypothetical protein
MALVGDQCSLKSTKSIMARYLRVFFPRIAWAKNSICRAKFPGQHLFVISIIRQAPFFCYFFQPIGADLGSGNDFDRVNLFVSF